MTNEGQQTVMTVFGDVGKPYEMSSYSEKKALKLIDDEPADFVKHANLQLCRIYPAGTRTDD